MACCWEADVKAENERIAGETSKFEPDLPGQEKQEKGHEGDNEVEKNKNAVPKYLPKSHKELP